MNERYQRNYPAITEDDQKTLKQKRVCIIGCGGLGGHVIDAIARIGVGHLTLVDCDTFSLSNMNRQLLATDKTLGHSKCEEAVNRVWDVNPDVIAKAVNKKLDISNALDIISDADLVIDALDNVEARRILAAACQRKGIYLIHGAVGKWNLQVGVMAPGSQLFEKIYPKDANLPPPSVLSFVPPVCAGIEVCEAIKILLGQKSELEGKLLLMDLKNNTFDIIKL